MFYKTYKTYQYYMKSCLSLETVQICYIIRRFSVWTDKYN